MTNEHDVPTDL